jgi:hypothetical protein
VLASNTSQGRQESVMAFVAKPTTARAAGGATPQARVCRAGAFLAWTL